LQDLHQKLDVAGGDTPKALLAWNGGGNPDYAEECWRGWRATVEALVRRRDRQTSGSWLKIAAVLIAAVVGVSVYFAWRGTQQGRRNSKRRYRPRRKRWEDADARSNRETRLGQLPGSA